MKQCNTCSKYKDEIQFARRSDERADGYQAHCLDCQAEKNKKHYKENREAIKARSLARKHAIAAGTYTPEKTTQQGREKRRIELPPPKPVREIVGFGLDENEYQFLIKISEERGLKMEQILRELIRSAMAAYEAQHRKQK